MGFLDNFSWGRKIKRKRRKKRKEASGFYTDKKSFTVEKKGRRSRYRRRQLRRQQTGILAPF